MKCTWHCCNKETPNDRLNRKFCSTKCKNKYHVNVRRKKLKILSVEHKGGCCEQCGYDKCIEALEFHHKDPSAKDFGISQNGHTRTWEVTKQELDKCIMLCANCHRELHVEIDKMAARAGIEPANEIPV
jgi:hypothetical protein